MISSPASSNRRFRPQRLPAHFNNRSASSHAATLRNVSRRSKHSSTVVGSAPLTAESPCGESPTAEALATEAAAAEAPAADAPEVETPEVETPEVDELGLAGLDWLSLLDGGDLFPVTA
jgi:hypothetical protein